MDKAQKLQLCIYPLHNNILNFPLDFFSTGLQAQEGIHSCRRSNEVNSEKLLEDDLRAQLCCGGDDIILS